ncbi:hypothetical protein [Acidithiobacillus ferrooxidans]|uniref:hypothetical protein n=1 Tax=Acidithiobacillus ferrooxidans TaxID=920 RepID=UPI001C0792B3|nr:hypothetical protein [Acidithiobacillus ferrooxidans]
MLFRWFDIEFVVEDEHASWFDDAQVKTTLIVAKRMKRRASALSRPEGASYCHIAISAAAATPQSPIDGSHCPASSGEELAKQARLWLRNTTSHANCLARARPVSLKLACRNMIASASRQKWFALIGEDENLTSDGINIPHEIHDWLSRRGLSPSFDTFESQGVAVGQGLRTGANGFFYADGERQGGEVALTFSGPLSGLTAKAPSSIAKPVLRRQSELPDGFAVSSATTRGYALNLRGHALPEDMAEAGNSASVPYKPMPTEVAAVVRAAARANFGTSKKPRKVFELTAVCTNIRSASRGAPARHWYMLPDLAHRHRPDVFLARVNAAIPKAYLNEGRECLIDANFSTMWAKSTSKWSANALLAFMNSTWAHAVIEFSGAVMGGGALKVEATHLRRFPVPSLSDDQIRRLDGLGANLAKGKSINEMVAAINAVIAISLGSDEEGIKELGDIAHAGQARRAKHNRKQGGIDGHDVC